MLRYHTLFSQRIYLIQFFSLTIPVWAEKQLQLDLNFVLKILVSIS